MKTCAKHALALAFLVGPAGLAAADEAAQSCEIVSGFVRLDPDPACAIKDVYPGPRYFGVPGTCFTISVKSQGPFKGARGVAGLTTELALAPLTPPFGVAALTALMLVETGVPWTPTEFGVPESRRFITARSVIITADGKSKVFTADAGIVGAAGAVEQLVITRGEGDFANSSGQVSVVGNSIRNYAPFTGQICRN